MPDLRVSHPILPQGHSIQVRCKGIPSKSAARASHPSPLLGHPIQVRRKGIPSKSTTRAFHPSPPHATTRAFHPYTAARCQILPISKNLSQNGGRTHKGRGKTHCQIPAITLAAKLLSKNIKHPAFTEVQLHQRQTSC